MKYNLLVALYAVCVLALFYWICFRLCRNSAERDKAEIEMVDEI
jgi:hypothetical protein